MTEPETKHAWQLDLDHLYRVGDALQTVLDTLPEGFALRLQWDPPGIDLVEFGGTLEWFKSKVEEMARAMGPPDVCEGQHWVGGGDRPPDLIAQWNRDVPGPDPEKPLIYRVTVRALDPSGCRVHPESKHVEAESTRLHPECADILSSLEDLPEAVPR